MISLNGAALSRIHLLTHPLEQSFHSHQPYHLSRNRRRNRPPPTIPISTAFDPLRPPVPTSPSILDILLLDAVLPIDVPVTRLWTITSWSIDSCRRDGRQHVRKLSRTPTAHIPTCYDMSWCGTSLRKLRPSQRLLPTTKRLWRSSKQQSTRQAYGPRDRTIVDRFLRTLVMTSANLWSVFLR